MVTCNLFVLVCFRFAWASYLITFILNSPGTPGAGFRRLIDSDFGVDKDLESDPFRKPDCVKTNSSSKSEKNGNHPRNQELLYLEDRIWFTVKMSKKNIFILLPDRSCILRLNSRIRNRHNFFM